MEEKVLETAAPVEANAPEAASAPSKENAPRGERRQGGNRRNRSEKRFNRSDRERKEYEERVVAINRVSKTVKGGRRMKFSALVVVGDGKGRYGFGTGKAGEVPDAIKKALEAAKKNIHKVHITKSGTISHEILGKYGACSVYLKAAPEGTGIVAGGPVRAVLELAGVRNVCSKVYGSRAPINIIRAVSSGLDNLHTFSEVKTLRGK